MQKIWQVKSNGCTSWPAGTRLVRVGGTALGADSAAVPIPNVGGVVDVTLPIKAPSAPGNYRSLYRLRTPGGVFFGDTLTIVFNVPTATAVPAPSSTATSAPSSGPATINSFQADRYVVAPGQCAQVSWNVDNAQAVFYQGQGVSGHDSHQECPSATTFYELRVQNRDGSFQSRSIALEVASTPPASGQPVISFVADRDRVDPGGCATLWWNVENVQAVFYQGQGVVGHDSSRECPTSTTTYELRVLLRDGNTVVRAITIQAP